MDKINWKRKLTSRKFWVAVATFVSMLIVAFGGTDSQAAEVTALIMAGAAVVAYIIGEGMTDAANAKTNVEIENLTESVYIPEAKEAEK